MRKKPNGEALDFHDWRREEWIPHRDRARVAMQQIQDTREAIAKIHGDTGHLRELPRMADAIEKMRDKLVTQATDKKFFFLVLAIMVIVIALGELRSSSKCFNWELGPLKVRMGDCSSAPAQ